MVVEEVNRARRVAGSKVEVNSGEMGPGSDEKAERRGLLGAWGLLCARNLRKVGRVRSDLTEGVFPVLVDNAGEGGDGNGSDFGRSFRGSDEGGVVPVGDAGALVV